MPQVTLAFHPSVALPAAAGGLAGEYVALEPGWSVRDLGAAAEQLAAARGVGLRVSALINPARGAAAPPHEPVEAHFNDGDRAIMLADAREELWPGVGGEASASKPRPPGAPVPVTIFTGFLGAGKTTVLNHLLRGQSDKKFAVIENEFGAVPIDNELLQNSALGMAEQVVVMENGCMCCTVRGDLLGAFDSIRKQMEKGSPLDAVLVETTGMADPVPIVRTMRQTPDIAKYFRLDGTITLVDTKTILSRLSEVEGGKQDQERHQQIAFADKILLNKLDLVDQEQVVQVWQRIRSFNASAPIVASVKGIVPPAELTGLNAFDAEQIALEEGGHGPGHGNGHGHGHGCDDDCDGSHGHGGHGGGHDGGHDGGDDHQEDHGHVIGHVHGHGLGKQHDSEIGSFSIVRSGAEVEPLAFARWVRVIATLPEAQGKLYRSKGVLAAAGRPAKLIFHAVADVTETSDGPAWGENEARGVKIVFIGKKLARQEIEARFLPLLQPVRPRLRALTPGLTPQPTLESLARRGLLHHALLGCWTRDMVKVSQASAGLRDALTAPAALAAFHAAAAAALPSGAPRGLHKVDGPLWLHALLPLVSIRRYAEAFKEARVTLATKSSGDYIYGEPLQFDTLGDVEAAGVMWLELGEIKDQTTANFVIEFHWRPETMQSFFSVAKSATSSALVKITVEDPSGDSEMDDDLRFRVNLNPEENEEQPGLVLHRMTLQLVGGKTSNHVYQIFFHTIDPTYQVHVNVPDHRTPIFPTREVFHQWHPVMAGLKQRPRLRFLLRLKSMESGPLDAMCGCCG